MNRQSGFTLIEVILATMLSALVLAGAFASLSTILTAYGAQEGQYDASRNASLILANMSKDLNAVYLSPHQPMTRMVGTDGRQGDFDSDTLTFISTINDVTKSGAGTSDLAEIQYYIDLDSSTPEKWLLRRYDITPDIDPFTGGTLALLGPQVVSLNFEYFDGMQWWPAWDSAEVLPIAVNIRIAIFKPEQQGQTATPQNVEYFSKLVWLGSYRDIPEEELSGATGSTTGEEAAEEGNAGGGGGGNPQEGPGGPGGAQGGGGGGGR